MNMIGLSKVMLSTLITGGAVLGINQLSAKAPIENRKGEAQIDFPSNVVEIGTLEESYELVFKLKSEAVKVEQDRLAEIERLKRIELEELERQRKIELEAKIKAELELKLAKQKKAEEDEKSKWMTFEASYYTAYCDSGCIGKTRSGYDVSKTIYYDGLRVIAADLSVIPLYSIVEINSGDSSYKGIVLDSGGAIRGFKLDVLVSSKKEAYALGRHDVQLKVIRYGKGD